MTIPQNKITIKDGSKKIFNTRDEFLDDGDLKKPFVFKGYKTEADRIKNTIKNNRYLYNLPDYDKIINSNNKFNEIKTTSATVYNFQPEITISELPPPMRQLSTMTNISTVDLKNFDYLLKNDIILQPIMRFKARTDLERVYDSLNSIHNRNNEKEILNRQLKSLNLLKEKRAKDYLKMEAIFGKDKNPNIEEEVPEEEKKGYKIIPNPLVVHKETKPKIKNKSLYAVPKYYFIPTEHDKKPWLKKGDINTEAEKVLYEYHKKTHFKAAEEIAENKMNSKIYLNNENISNNNIYKPSLTESSKNQKKNKNLISEQFLITKEKFKTNTSNIYYEKFNKNYNPMVKKKYETIDSDKLNKLKQIAFVEPINEDLNRKKSDDELAIQNFEQREKQKLVDENSVLIGNELLYKGNQMDIIANRVLNLCNVYSKKSKHNKGSLIKKNGKTMITKGLTVKQFEEKYNVPD